MTTKDGEEDDQDEGDDCQEGSGKDRGHIKFHGCANAASDCVVYAIAFATALGSGEALRVLSIKSATKCKHNRRKMLASSHTTRNAPMVLLSPICYLINVSTFCIH